MEGSLKELAGYRLERARDMLSASDNNLKIGEYRRIQDFIEQIILCSFPYNAFSKSIKRV